DLAGPDRERHAVEGGDGAEALRDAVELEQRGGQDSRTLIFPARMSFLISSSLASIAGVPPVQTAMSDALGPMASPNGLNSAFHVPATSWSMAYSTWYPTPVMV